MSEPYILTDRHGAHLVVRGTGDRIYLTGAGIRPSRDQAHDLADELNRRANQEGT